jgi:hypothetical protein
MPRLPFICVALIAGLCSTAAADPLSEDIDYRIIGYLRIQGAIVQNDPDVAFVGRNDGFRLQNARVGIDGTWKQAIRLRLSADGAIDEREDPNAVEGTLRFAVKDAFADVLLSPYATLRLARFKIVYDMEEDLPPAERTFINPALSSRGTLATEGFETRGLGVSRNLGIALRADAAVESSGVALGYELAAQNGNGELDSANDNDSLAYSAAVFATIAERATVHVAGRFNRRTEGELPFRRTEDDWGAAVGVRYAYAPIRATAQLLVRRTMFPTTGGDAENAFGAHADAAVTIPGADWLEAGYRYAILDPSDLIPSDRVQEHTAGVNFRVPSYRLRLQLNYTHTVEQGGRVLDNDRVEGLVEVSL